MRNFHWGLLALTASLSQTIASPSTSSFSLSTQEKRALLQDIVTWDQHSLFVRGERLMIFSGEFHPFRLPVPGLWLDVFQKIKSLGFNAVSFYTCWGLLEGNPGHVVTDGIWSLDEFFDAASEAGIYLVARPGPYINAETAAGGIPGWVLREKGVIRSNSSDYFAATQNYMKTMGGIIEKAQITNGGPVIFVQPENEYTTWPGVSAADFPTEMNRDVMAFVENQLRDAGIVVPFSVNDNENMGYFAPGSGLGAVDLYGIDSYPMRYDCGDPYTWPTYRFPMNWQLTHFNNSPTTPNAVMEFQGGSGEGWGGVTEDMCADLVNMEAVRVVNKNTFGFGVTMFNIYMTYGGTNWGNLGHMGGYTSYDYGAAINEQREIWREKYSEEKLQANFFKVSPAFLTATPGIGVNGSYTGNDNIAVTPLFGNGTNTNFYLVRHADFTYTGDENYRLQVSTSAGNVTIPQLGGSLSLNGRDSKFHVTDYDVGGINLIYSSAEVFTWTKGSGNDRVLLLYGGADELHEFALPATLAKPAVVEGAGVQVVNKGNTWVIQWQVTPSRRVVRVGDLEIHLLWRNDAYQHWALELPAAEPIGNFASPSKQSVIVKGGYLLRTASLSGNILELTGDVNATTTLEVISTPNAHLNGIVFNGDLLKTSQSSIGKLTATISYHSPHVSLPNLAEQEWKYLDSLPEIQSKYNDNEWTALTHTTTNNSLSLTTPTSLYADDYGYHTGSLIYRGHFTANGQESWVFFNASGGEGFGASAWVDGTLLGSWTGSGSDVFYPLNLTIPHKLSAGEHVFTVVIDHMGADEEAPGTDVIKFPRGILNYALSGHSLSDLTWKMTGNLGGEQYIDLTRGPRNEGAMYAERQGYHLPNPPSSTWKTYNPVQNGVSEAGIGFFATSFNLDLPQGYDIPLNFVFNSSAPASGTGNNYRVQLFVNGYQFGKYINNVGPQTVYPVPEGILNYNGNNYIAVTLWAQDADGARIGGLDLVASTLVQSGYRKPALSPQPAWELRKGAY